MFTTFSPTKDLLVILLIVLLIFGPKRLPGLGKQLGQGIREFKDSLTKGDGDGAADSEPAQIAQTGATSAPGAVAAEQQTAERAPSEPRA